jgi:hypothetical protein
MSADPTTGGPASPPRAIAIKDWVLLDGAMVVGGRLDRAAD